MVVTSDHQPVVSASPDVDSGKNVSRRQLVNKLNFINFQDETIVAHFKHARYDSGVSLRVKPLPCAGEQLECSWSVTNDASQLLKQCHFEYLLIPDGKKYFLVIPKLLSMDDTRISFILPLNGREFKIRKIERHYCKGITARFTQNSVMLKGILADFTPISLRIEGKTDPPEALRWINPEVPLNLHLYSGSRLLYSGECFILRQGGKGDTASYVLKTENNSIQRFKEKKYRCDRLQLVPSPNILFEHPFTGKTINLKVADLSGSGCSVEEHEENSVLLPGMMIPNLQLTFAHGLHITCTTQVVSRNCIEESGGDTLVRCSLVFLDMDIHGHVKLMSILHQAADKYSYICTEVDMDALWDFFFETGFIYPEKYAFFQVEKEEIKKTYAKLYGGNPHIARHFIHQNRGTILGHMAMVRFYENSWLIHHHAARKSASLKAGLTVLSQISHYINELHNQYFAHLDYVYCYFRPENKFPNRVFGGFASQLNNKRGCSLDKFAYFHYHKTIVNQSEMCRPWELFESCAADFEELGNYYGYVSGGLMVDASDLRPDRVNDPGLAKEYEKLGFKKERYAFSLKREGSLKAMVLVNLTDAGFNMANLTNCATLMLLDEDIPRGVVDATLEQVSGKHYGHEMPVLLYPFSYVETNSYPYEKSYMLWILNLNYSDDYFKYCDGLFKGSGKTT
ncbi:MAG: pilus assembly protein PilZ [Desulfuromonadales bacterium]|nr:pilus assembly protein PilZ [Desulfuromonadales bacterium]